MSNEPQVTNFSRIELALNQIYPREVDNLEHIAAWAEYYELLSGGGTPRKFWQRPWDITNDESKQYLISTRSNRLFAARWIEAEQGWGVETLDKYLRADNPDNEVVYVAEIPPLPDAKDEVKP